MDRTSSSGQGSVPAGDEEMVRDGSLIIDESAVRREGLVEYEGTVGESDTSHAGHAGHSSHTSHAVETDVSMGTTSTGTTGTGSMGGDDLSMSTDNTSTAGTMAGGGSAHLAHIREGMTVIDANGDEVGKVSYVKMGDPEAMSTMGEEMDTGGGFLGGFLGDDNEPDVPDPFRSELIRDGFVKVDTKGFFGSDRYLPSNTIGTVSSDTVTLTVTRDSIPDGQG